MTNTNIEGFRNYLKCIAEDLQRADGNVLTYLGGQWEPAHYGELDGYVDLYYSRSCYKDLQDCSTELQDYLWHRKYDKDSSKRPKLQNPYHYTQFSPLALENGLSANYDTWLVKWLTAYDQDDTTDPRDELPDINIQGLSDYVENASIEELNAMLKSLLIAIELDISVLQTVIKNFQTKQIPVLSESEIKEVKDNTPVFGFNPFNGPHNLEERQTRNVEKRSSKLLHARLNIALSARWYFKGFEVKTDFLTDIWDPFKLNY